MISVIGTILAPSGISYIDPLINVYFLSYNPVSDIFAIPQILDDVSYSDSISPIDQLDIVSITDRNANRDQITSIVLMVLENTYPNCTFEII